MARRVSLSFDDCTSGTRQILVLDKRQGSGSRRTGRDTLLGDGEEGVGRTSRSDSIDSDLKVSIGTVLESDWHRHTGS